MTKLFERVFVALTGIGHASISRRILFLEPNLSSTSKLLPRDEGCPVLSTTDLLIHLEIVDLDRLLKRRWRFSSTFIWQWLILDLAQE